MCTSCPVELENSEIRNLFQHLIRCKFYNHGYHQSQCGPGINMFKKVFPRVHVHGKLKLAHRFFLNFAWLHRITQESKVLHVVVLGKLNPPRATFWVIFPTSNLMQPRSSMIFFIFETASKCKQISFVFYSPNWYGFSLQSNKKFNLKARYHDTCFVFMNRN